MNETLKDRAGAADPSEVHLWRRFENTGGQNDVPWRLFAAEFASVLLITVIAWAVSSFT